MVQSEDHPREGANNQSEAENGLLHEEFHGKCYLTHEYPSHEKTSLLQHKCKAKEDHGDQDDVPLMIKTYKSRFWIVFLASFLCWLHTLQWSMWGPISESMDAAFPGWGSSTIALMANWGTIMFMLCVIPLSWVMQQYGLRTGVVTSATFMAIGTGIRCFTKETPVFTIMCHICAILVGGASALALITPVAISNDWFPQHERTTATGVILGFSQMGSVGSYLEPTIIRMPYPGVTKEDIQQDVMHLVYAGAIMSALLLLALLAYFPSKPPSPPSLSSTSEKYDFLPGLVSITKNKKFLLVVASYGIFVGPPIAWVTVLDFSLLPLGFHQDKAMWVGVLAVIISGASPILSGRVNDLLQGNTKTLLITLMLATTACCYWFLLLSYSILEVTDWQVYTSVIGVCAFNYASMPLFYEVAVDMAYPVPEIPVTAVMTAADCFVSTLFLSIYSIPNIGYLWITYTMTMTSSLSIIPLLFIRFDYTRANIDCRTYSE